MMAPMRLTPLDLLPEHPNPRPALLLLAVLGLIAITALLWRWRRRHQSLVAATAAYLALLAPAAALVAGGLQQTADRYTYVPDVVLAIAVAIAGAAWARSHAPRPQIAAGIAVVAIVVAALGARAALPPWRDSISLWSHAIHVDPANHVAHYNLAVALGAAGRAEEAADRYRQVLALQPSHAPARRNLDRIEAARFEREGNESAARGDLRTAAARYARAVDLDEQRTHSQAALGMALASEGHRTEAIAPLRAAVKQGVRDVAVSNTLAALLMEAGQPREARAVLETALSVHQDDIGLAHNLARLLSTEPVFAKTDAALALRLANAVVSATGGRDPRALDTLAAALAINGRMREAAETSARAAALATSQGDREMAVQITARGRAYRNPGR
jgi:tetratricopeptide (TPR) repeat protein